MRRRHLLNLLLIIGLVLPVGCGPSQEELKAAKEAKAAAEEAKATAEEAKAAAEEAKAAKEAKAAEEAKAAHKKEVAAFCKEFSEYYKVTENEVTGDWKMKLNYGVGNSKYLKPNTFSWFAYNTFEFDFEISEIRYGIDKIKRPLYLKIDEEKVTLEPTREPYNYISGERMRDHHYKVSLETLNKMASATSVKYSLNDEVRDFGSEELIKKLATYFNVLNAKKKKAE